MTWCRWPACKAPGGREGGKEGGREEGREEKSFHGNVCMHGRDVFKGGRRAAGRNKFAWLVSFRESQNTQKKNNKNKRDENSRVMSLYFFLSFEFSLAHLVATYD